LGAAGAGNLEGCQGKTVSHSFKDVAAQPAESPHDGHSAQPGAKVREVKSEDLFQGQKTVVIRHGAEVYRLLLTRHNKLILQK